MKALLASTLLFILTALAQAQQAPTFEQQRAASSRAVMVKYPEAADPYSRLSDIAGEIVRDWKAKQDWRVATADFPMYLWDAAAIQLRVEKESAALQQALAANAAQAEARKAEIQRQLEVRLAQIRATNYVTPATAPVSSPRLPISKSGSSTTTVSGSGGVYTTHGGSAGGATIIHSGGGHYQIHTKDGQTRQVIIATP